MDIQVLREFLDLSFTLNFSKSAERMYISQSALSKHIAQLEKELGVQLFQRSKQAVQLTPVGVALQDKFKLVIKDYDDALALIKNEEANLKGSIRIGYLDAAVRSLLSGAVHNMSQKYPSVSISLKSYEVGELNDALRQDIIDIALCIAYPNSAIPHNTFFKPLYNDGISAVVSKDNPLAQKKEIAFHELLDYPMILPSPVQYPSYAAIIRKMVESAPKEANIICDFSNTLTALIMVESEMGVSVLPTNLSNQPSTAIFIPLKDANPVLQVGAMWKKDNLSPGINEFVEEISSLSTELYYKQ